MHRFNRMVYLYTFKTMLNIIHMKRMCFWVYKNVQNRLMYMIWTHCWATFLCKYCVFILYSSFSLDTSLIPILKTLSFTELSSFFHVCSSLGCLSLYSSRTFSFTSFAWGLNLSPNSLLYSFPRLFLNLTPSLLPLAQSKFSALLI